MMVKHLAVVLVLIEFFSTGVAFQGLSRQWKIVSSYHSTATELETKLSSGLTSLPVRRQSKRYMIDKLTKVPVGPSAETPKKLSRLGGLLLRKRKVLAAPEKEEVKTETIEMPIIAQKKPLAEIKKPKVAVAKQWESRKEVVTKTPTIEVKKVVPISLAAVKVELAVPMVSSGKTVKSVKQVVAAYDIDDDDFMNQFMDEGEALLNKGKAASQRSATVASSSMTSSADSPRSEVADSRSAWPGPGVPWMSGPVDNNMKKDQNRGRNALMATADDDLQRMVDQRNEARYRRDYDGADAIREELRTIFRVEIYDKLGEWVAADGRWGLSNRKRGAGTEDGVPVMAKIQTDATPCSLTYDQVMDLVIKRTTARRNRQFQVADDIRNELARMGVELFDKVNEWRTFDGQMRGIQSEDFGKYEVKKDNERYDGGNSRDNSW